MPKPWMIYGANGYTGELIARDAVRRGLKPMLAGRSAVKVEPLAEALGLQARVFDLRDAAATARSVQGMETSLRNAKLWGAGVVLLVPAVVNAETGYQDAWTSSQKVIRERILPLATELQVIIGIEEVWNKFLLSPLELNKYVDEFGSPWVRAYEDVGNMIFYGYPQDWIRTVGKRTVRVHLKDFLLDRPNGKFFWKNLGEGDIDWPEVRKALGEIGFDSWATVELQGGDAAYLKDVSARVDRFLAGQKPVAAAAGA